MSPRALGSLVAMVTLAFVALPASAAQAQHPTKGKVGVVEISRLVVGTVTLEPGTYRVECKHIDGRDYLVVSTTANVEMARVPCSPVSLARKVQLTEVRTAKRPDGMLVLTEVRIAGEAIGHAAANPPTT